MSVDLGGLEVDYPGIEPNLCRIVQCPIVQGRSYQATQTVATSNDFPSMTTTLKIVGTGDNGQLFCGFAQVGIVD